MTPSSSEKAVVAVQRFAQLVEDIKKQHPTLAQHIDAVAIDDMEYFVNSIQPREISL